MIELVVTSFPFLIRLAYLRWRGIPVTLYNVHRALFIWFVLALMVFFAIFYFYPKSYTGIVPYRTVPVVAETSGTVTEVFVTGGQHVKVGDALFTVDNSNQVIDVELAKSKVAEVESALAAAEAEVEMAEAAHAAAKANLTQSAVNASDQMELQARDSAAFHKSQLERASATVEARAAEVQATQAQIVAAKVQLNDILPAQLASAEAALDQAELTLANTTTYSRVNGTVEQVTLNAGARVASVPMSPAMLIVPDRNGATSGRIVAGISQVSRRELHEGMAAEVACESNFNISMRDTVLPARITRIQEPISSGALGPSGRLVEPGAVAKRGQVVVHLDLVHEEHREHLVPGGACMVQLYTTDLNGELSGTTAAHVIQVLGIIKAYGLRIKAWLGLASGIGLAGGGH